MFRLSRWRILKAKSSKQHRMNNAHPDTALVLHHLADVLREQGTLDEAEALARQSLDIYRTDPKANSGAYTHAIRVLAQTLTDAGRTGAAGALRRD